MTVELYSRPDELALEKIAVPAGETIILVAKSENNDLFYAAQIFRHLDAEVDYYAVRLRYIGGITYSPSREASDFIWSETPEFSDYKPNFNAFHAVVDKKMRAVKFGPKGNIFLMYEHRNRGLASYAMSLIIRYLKKNYSDFKVRRGSLSSVDADPENFDIRHHFYLNLGLIPKYRNDKGDGSFGAAAVSDLKENINPKKIEEIGMDGIFIRYSQSVENHSDLKRFNQSLKSENSILISQKLKMGKYLAFFKVVLCSIVFVTLSFYFAF